MIRDTFDSRREAVDHLRRCGWVLLTRTPETRLIRQDYTGLWIATVSETGAITFAPAPPRDGGAS